RRRAMLIVDPPVAWSANKETAAATAKQKLTDLGLTGTAARNAVLYFPRIRYPDPHRDNQAATFVPCGMVAGMMARTDAQRGVWKAPAGIDAALTGTQALEVRLTDDENGMLNPLGINCLRTFPLIGSVSWGARTLRGADLLADEYKYVPVRRLALYIEESLYRGLKWVVFEPNDEPLWAQIRLNVGAFMHNLFRQGAFQGSSPRQAYFVKCDGESTTQNDINLGIVNIVVGFAPLKPAEFVIIKLQQMAGQLEA
ncbi:MAG: phage tail sheath family protein, partial [Anaerolineales bacterium]|nr:phage tail sheath family protein [Anaerolineales bacterium]